jgi:hypothetical protein
MLSVPRTLLGLAALTSCAAAMHIGCAPPPQEEPTDALDSALNAEDFDATVKHLSALPWLPWTYLTDGCYARAFYYSMLLASKNVPTNHVYVVRQAGAPPLFGIWGWHVAPVVTKNKDPNHLYVLDPAYDQTRALTNVEWVAKQNYPDPAAANYPKLHVYPGNSYLDQYTTLQPLVNPAEPEAALYKEPVFEQMPAFAMSDVSASCSVMHRYIDIEPNSTVATRAEKHSGLGRETQRLVRSLVLKHKISGNPVLSASCTRNEPIDPPVTNTDAGSSEPPPPAPTTTTTPPNTTTPPSTTTTPPSTLPDEPTRVHE